MSKSRQIYNHTDDDIESKLPLQVTRISVQKKNRDRYSLFHDELFLIGISRKTLEDFSAKEGDILTPSLLKQLNNSENLLAIREACFRYLSGRDHSSFELKQKVCKKGYHKNDIDRVIEELSQSGYLNDKEFALKFVNEKIKINRWGPRKVQSHLFKKGINRRIIDDALNQETDDLQQQQICVDLIMKRKHHFLRETDVYKREQKIYRYLAGRGFSGSIIKTSLPRIIKELHA